MKLIGTRREFLRASAAAGGSSLLLSGCLHGAATKSEPASGDEAAAKNKESSKMGGEVTATEDLMREHGVLRRALLIYTATATKLREDVDSQGELEYIYGDTTYSDGLQC